MVKHTEMDTAMRQASTAFRGRLLAPLTLRAENNQRGARLRASHAAALAMVLTVGLASCAPVFEAVEQQFKPQQPSPEQAMNFDAQQPQWSSCYQGMQCARVYAPLDWEHPEGERIELALVKQPALSGEAHGSLFVNPGGPGASGVDYIAQNIDYAVREPLQQSYDVIGWDPRGVGSSTAVVCLDDSEMDDYLFGLDTSEGLEPGSEPWIEKAVQESAEFGAACLEHTGPLLGHIDTASTVRDLDMLRAIVGDSTLNYLGYSYGTYIGARYADAFPDRVGRLVLDGAMDPTITEVDLVREQTRGFELALRAYVSECVTRTNCPVSGSVDQAMAQWRQLLDRVNAEPVTGDDGRIVGVGTLLTAIITPLYSQQSWPYLDELYATMMAGDADIALLLADFYYDRVNGEYTSNLITAFAAINCLDYPRPPLNADRMREQAAELEQIAPTIGAFQGYGDVSCAKWPVPGVTERLPVHAVGANPILVIGTTGDPATPFRWSESLADQLHSGVLLTYEGEGHTAYGGQNMCVNEIVEDYLLAGAVPQPGARCSG